MSIWEGWADCNLHTLWRRLALHDGIAQTQLLGRSFFQEKYRRLLAHGHELLCKELCLVRLHNASCEALGSNHFDRSGTLMIPLSVLRMLS